MSQLQKKPDSTSLLNEPAEVEKRSTTDPMKSGLAGLTYEQQVQQLKPDLPVGVSLSSQVQQKRGLPEHDSTQGDVSALQFSPAPPSTPPAPPINAGSTVADVKSYCAPDNIAMQKLRDVDAEQYCIDGTTNEAAKTGFYQAVGNYINSNHTSLDPGAVYNSCFDNLAGPWKNKGKPVPASKLSPFLLRTNGFSTFFQYQCLKKTEYEQRARRLLVAGVASGEILDIAMKTLRYNVGLGNENMNDLFNKTVDITPPWGPSWFSTDQVEWAASPETNFAGLLTLNALQPEFFPDGTVSYKVKKEAFIQGGVELRKPTIYDGMQSGLWSPRNIDGNAFGVTGGGASEFLANSINGRFVEEVRGSFPAEEIVTALKALQKKAQEEYLNNNPALKTKLENAEQQVERLSSRGADVTDAKKRVKELRGLIPNLTDLYMRGERPSLDAAMQAHGEEALRILDRILERREQESETPSNRSRRPTHNLEESATGR
jgi:hypothetical protein